MTFDGEDRVEIILLLHEITEIARYHSGDSSPVCLRPERWVDRELLIFDFLLLRIHDGIGWIVASLLAWLEIVAVVEIHSL